MVSNPEGKVPDHQVGQIGSQSDLHPLWDCVHLNVINEKLLLDVALKSVFIESHVSFFVCQVLLHLVVQILTKLHEELYCLDLAITHHEIHICIVK